MRAALLLVAAMTAGAATWAAPTDTLTVASLRGERRVPVVADRGFPAVAAAPLSAIIDLAPTTGAPGTLSLRVAGRIFDFVMGAGYFRFDQRSFPMASAPYWARDSLFIPLEFVTQQIPNLLSARYRYDAARSRLEEIPEPSVIHSAPGSTPAPPARTAAPRRARIVAIDPGHGGVDPGMSGPIGARPARLREKEITFAIARNVARELQSRGYGTYLTRSTDTIISLSHRGRRAATAGADIFVSIHVNAADPSWRSARQARGFEVYFLGEALTEDARRAAAMENAAVRFETEVTTDRGDPLSDILRDLAQNEHLRESSRLAQRVQTAMGRVHPGRSRGVKQAPYTVLYTTYMPAILIETGFGSHEAEARYLLSDDGQRRLARAIADGIAAYLADYERRLEQ